MTLLFSDVYRRLTRPSPMIRERSRNYGAGHIRERLVRCIWLDQRIRGRDLRTEDGHKLKIVSPGWWNLHEGPVFRHAEIMLDGKVMKGDVEIHLFSSDWRRHGHNKDARYGDVILHVAMWNDGKAKKVVSSSGRLIPQLILENRLTEELDSLAETIDLGHYPWASKSGFGDCYPALRKMAPERISRFIDIAGEERMLLKADRFRARMRKVSLDQVLYEGIMGALGYGAMKEALIRLARLLPIKDIRKIAGSSPTAEKLEALLFGVAGLLPSPEGTDDETDTYVEKLNRLWSNMAQRLKVSTMEKENWRAKGVRPASFPMRRIAGIAILLQRHLSEGLFQKVADTFSLPEPEVRRSARKLLLVDSDEYWAYRYSWGGRKSRHLRLIGQQKGRVILIDVLIPFMLAHAKRKGDRKLEEKLYHIFSSHPRLPADRIIRFTAWRMLGKKKMSLINSAKRQQGLHQIFEDFCSKDCSGCKVISLIDQL